MTDDVDSGGGLTDDEVLYVAGASYVAEWRLAREAAGLWVDVLAASGVDVSEVRAVPLTGSAGQGEVELRLPAAQLEWAASMVARGAGVTCANDIERGGYLS